MSYKASVYISGAVTQHLYHKDLDKLRERAIKTLTLWEPGFGSSWPLRLDLQKHVRTLSGNRAQWEVIETIQYKELPEEKHEWRHEKARRAAKRAEEAAR